MLQECFIDFEVIQDYNGGARGEKITIGRVRLNLAEYADIHDEEGQVMVRRYLMQDSKINSTVKIGLGMSQVDGDRNFIAPPLRTAAVFEGFTGVMAVEQEKDKTGCTYPSDTTLIVSPLLILPRYRRNRHQQRTRRNARHVPANPRCLLALRQRYSRSRPMHRRHLQRRRRLGQQACPCHTEPRSFNRARGRRQRRRGHGHRDTAEPASAPASSAPSPAPSPARPQ